MALTLRKRLPGDRSCTFSGPSAVRARAYIDVANTLQSGCGIQNASRFGYDVVRWHRFARATDSACRQTALASNNTRLQYLQRVDGDAEGAISCTAHQRGCR